MTLTGKFNYALKMVVTCIYSDFIRENHQTDENKNIFIQGKPKCLFILFEKQIQILDGLKTHHCAVFMGLSRMVETFYLKIIVFVLHFKPSSFRKF